MNLVETTCARCRERIRLPVGDIRLWRQGATTLFAYLCPSCDTPMAHHADENHVAVLAAAGVAFEGRPPADGRALLGVCRPRLPRRQTHRRPHIVM